MVQTRPFAVRNRSNRIATFGDSRTANGWFTDSSTIKSLGRGHMVRAAAKLRQRIRHDPAVYTDGGDAYAVSGYTTSQMISNGLHTALVAEHQADNHADPYAYVVILASTNDRSDSSLFNYATTIANFQTLRDTFYNAGIPIIWLDEMPRSDSGVTNWGSNGQLQIHHRVSQWLRSRNGLPGETTLSIYGRMVDPTSSTSAPVTAQFADNLHPNFVGADGVGDILAAYLEPFYPAGPDFLPISAADVYNATNNPYGCINANPFLTGTGGTVAGTGISGTLPDSFTSAYAGSGTAACVFSKYTHTDGTVWVRAVLSGTPAAAGTITVALPSMTSSITSGDVIDVVMETMVDANQTGLNHFNLQIFDGGASGGAKNRSDMSFNGTSDAYPVFATQKREVQRIRRFTIATAGTLTPTVRIGVRAEALSATVYFRGIAVRKNLPYNF